ncbi:hypothetical protein [Nocardioides sp. SYSU D00065]|uniref:hypothetical protein n=1 Tax=Nocardioides sp. SYSU D00065 TaxID=2817378 RepID=UPI001B31D99D|nr:hypothetical protein [Nocardioides sp. SYSU D00065]
MPTTVRPRGPLPARVYWTRRLVVLGVPLLLVVVLARVLGGTSEGREAAGDRATQAGATVTTTAPSAGPTAEVPAGKGGQQQEVAPPEPVLAEPSGPCADSDIVATPAITSVPGGADIPITINLRTAVTEACTWQASPESMTVTITSGSDFIWSTRECPAAIPVQDLVVRQGVDTPVVVTWSGRRSDETCSRFAAWAMPGFYHVQAAALGGEPTDVQFELVAPQPGVVTKTADPQPQGGASDGASGGKSRGTNGDTAHVPGEDGNGNSAG